MILTTGGDDDMTQLLNTLHSVSKTELQLKIDILEALKLCLKESHRTRTIFRKVGYLIFYSNLTTLMYLFLFR